MTTVSAIRNTRARDLVLPSSGLSGASRRQRYGFLNSSGSRKASLRGLDRSSPPIPSLIGESDDFRPWGTRLYWWSSGAFASKGLLEGNQYLAGRRAPPLLLK